MPHLIAFAPQIWLQDQSLSVMGLELGARMTLVRLADGSLFVHSPNQLTEEIRREVDALGPVAHVVSPNTMHHLYVAEWRAAYPRAKHYAVPGLPEKRKEFAFDGVIGNDQDKPWNPELRHLLVAGTPFNEAVFFHAASRTLILTDLALHVRESPSWVTRLAFRLMGAYGKFGWSAFEKRLFIRDRQKFAASLAELREWDFDRVVVSHGEPLQTGGRAAMARAFPERP